MDFATIEAVVREGVRMAGQPCDVHRSEDGGYLYLTLREEQGPQPPEAPRSARFWTTGVEAFFLDLDNGYSYRDFEWQEDAQVAIVRRLARLAGAYLAGAGEERRVRQRFGRVKRQFDIELDGERVTFTR